MAAVRPLPGKFEHFFGDLHDPRQQGSVDYLLTHILFMAFCAVLAGNTGWDGMAQFAKSKRAFFEQFFPLQDATPSADTFRRVFEHLLPKPFRQAFMAWADALAADLAEQVVAIDGKSMRGVVEAARPTSPLHLLHVWAVEQQLLLGVVRVDGAPGETRGIDEVLDLLSLQGAIVTVDANGCTQRVARKIIDSEADYAMALKGNRGPIYHAVTEHFERGRERSYRGGFRVHHDKSVGHGRVERRVAHVCSADFLPDEMRSKWAELASVVELTRTREVGGAESCERHYYLTSLAADAEQIATVVRAHWSVENQLHWPLDVSLGEDGCRIRHMTSAENIGLLRRMAINKLRHPDAGKQSQVMKQRMAGWDEAYLLKLLSLGRRPEAD